MAVSFPRSFPAGRFDRGQLVLDPFTSTNRLAGGKTQSRSLAEPRWRGSFLTVALFNATSLRIWEAWLDSLKGGVKEFYAYDPRYPFPQDYPESTTDAGDAWTGLTRFGGGGFDGTGTVTALTATTIAIGTLPVGFTLKIGDLIGLVEGDYRGLFRILEDATGDAGGAATVTVEPSTNPAGTTLFTTSATFNLEKPVVVMTLEDEFTEHPDDRLFGAVAFRCVQKIL